mmetsp:Transcript_98697/g.254997  ORF Transcript_98697/g.254997 Transcript_98697/m.254997 type:complete len:264 (-) Transcript_98697:1200-1991(-)
MAWIPTLAVQLAHRALQGVAGDRISVEHGICSAVDLLHHPGLRLQHGHGVANWDDAHNVVHDRIILLRPHTHGPPHAGLAVGQPDGREGHGGHSEEGASGLCHPAAERVPCEQRREALSSRLLDAALDVPQLLHVHVLVDVAPHENLLRQEVLPDLVPHQHPERHRVIHEDVPKQAWRPKIGVVGPILCDCRSADGDYVNAGLWQPEVHHSGRFQRILGGNHEAPFGELCTSKATPDRHVESFDVPPIRSVGEESQIQRREAM